jgi:hypothetical protein
MLLHIDPLLGNDSGISNYTTAVTRQRYKNYKRGMVFSAQSVPMAGHATMEYIMPSLSNNCTAKRKRYFLRGPYRDVISRTS